MRYVKQTVSALSVALISIASAYVMDVDEVMGEEVYNVQLKVETVEVDINEIPENREVRVGVSIENNPGFLGLWFPIEWDDRLSYDWYRLYDFDFRKLCISIAIMESSDSVTEFAMSNYDLNSLYYENNTLVTFNFKLPEQVKVGDFFYVNLLDFFNDNGVTYSSIFTQEDSFDNDHGSESFAPFINGGIRIVGQEPVQEPPQESEPPVQPSEPDIAPPQPAEDSQQNNNVQQQVIEETTAPVTEVTTIETTTVTTSTTTVTTVPETTVSATVSTTETEKTTTEETTVLETTVTEVSENSTDDEEGKRNIIPILVVGIAVIIAVITGVIFRRKKENKDEKK